MFKLLQFLLKDFSFLLKVLKLILSTVCLSEIAKYKEYSIPRWLWVIYCIDTSTYTIIYVVLGLTHIFEKPRKLPQFVFFTLGLILHLVGAIGGIERSRNETSLDVASQRSELKVGMLLLGNFIILFFETLYMVYSEVSLKSRHELATTASVHAN